MIPIAVASAFIADTAPVAIDREMTQLICGYVHVSTPSTELKSNAA